MMWLEEKEPSWDLLGHTISQDQLTYIDDKLPAHKFKAKLVRWLAWTCMDAIPRGSWVCLFVLPLSCIPP